LVNTELIKKQSLLALVFYSQQSQE